MAIPLSTNDPRLHQTPKAAIRRLGIPDRFIEHGERDELLADLRLDSAGICQTIREAARSEFSLESSVRLKSTASTA